MVAATRQKAFYSFQKRTPVRHAAHVSFLMMKHSKHAESKALFLIKHKQLFDIALNPHYIH